MTSSAGPASRPPAPPDLAPLQRTVDQLLPAVHRLLELLEKDDKTAESRLAELMAELDRTADSLGATVTALERLSGSGSVMEMVLTRTNQLAEVQSRQDSMLQEILANGETLLDWLGADAPRRPAASRRS